MTAGRIERFPLFPLGLVLLPHEVVPLHIFEERYKAMIGECLDEQREFGIVWLSQDGLRQIGCGARVARVLERTEDGRMNILAEGTRPFRLLRRIDDLVYPAGEVELLEDADAEAAIDSELLAAALERYADVVDRATDTRPEPSDLTGLDAYRMAAMVDFDLAAKQELLELRGEEARLRRVRELFDLMLAQIDHAERTGEIARTNGRARQGRP
ncbi:MAG: LON peptidase substrate-binding domain-containing protein [Actinomycetota bacterium]|nr:LON peptidase substrate-binding domain-containing protein [Actinomycetota bacterium]